MKPKSPLTLRCEECGHEWSARNTPGKKRQCSACRSRKVVEAPSIEITDADVLVDAVDQPTEPRIAQTLMDDPEIRQKQKELDLARLEKQIRDAKGELIDAKALERFFVNFQLLLDNLSGYLDEGTMKMLLTSCPWCGADYDEGMMREERRKGGKNGVGCRCSSCDRWVKF